MAASGKKIVMAGVAMQSPGGMTSVVRCYRKFGLFDRHDVVYLETYRNPGLLSQLRVFVPAVWKLLAMLLGREVALLHVHTASYGSFGRKSILCAFARAFSVPYIVHVHCGEFLDFYQRHRGRPAGRFIARTLDNACLVWVLSEGWKERFSAVFPLARGEVLTNPVEPAQGVGEVSAATRYILFLGRLRQKKGVYDLVRAFARIRSEFPDVSLVLAGDGELDEVGQLAAELGVADAVRLTGWVEDDAKQRLLSGAEVLALPSYFEGLPISILEAMAAGVPVIASRVGSIPEALEDGRCGVLFQPGDVDALADGLKSLLENSCFASMLSSLGLERVNQHYAVKPVIHRLEKVYRECAIK